MAQFGREIMNNFGLKDVLKRFGPYFKDYIPHFIFAIIGMGLASGGTAVSAYLVEPVLNKIFVEKNEKLLYILPCAIIAIYVIKNIGTFMQAYFTAYIGQDTIRRFREKMVANLLNLDMDFFNEFRTGELISRTTNDIDRIRSIVSSIIPELTRESVTIIGLLCVVIYQSPKLAFFALVVMPVAIYPISRLAKRMKKISKQSQEKTSDITSALSEIFTNIEIIKANNAQEYEHSRFVDENNKFFRLNLKSVKIEQLVSPLMETIGSIGVAAVIIIGGKDVIDGHINMGAFFSFLTALFMLYTPLKRIVNIYNKMQDAIAASERTFFLMDKVSQIKDGQKELNEEINLIKFNDVRLSYGDKEVLKGINLEIKQNEFCVLLGGSGSGKTTLLNILSGTSELSSGEISMQNKIYTKKISLDKSRQIITQTYSLMPWLSAKDNIKFALKCSGIKDKFEQEKRASKFLELVSLSHKAELFPHSLSGGQKQRVAIARALSLSPEVLFLDEPFSALDPITRTNLQKSLKQMSKTQTTIFVTHDIDEALFLADKIVILHDGVIIKEISNPNFGVHDLKYFELKAKIFDLINGEDNEVEYTI